MISKAILITLVCLGVLIIIQSTIPKAMAMKTTRNVDEFMIEGQRTHKKHNYMFQRIKNNDELRNNNGFVYDYIEPFDLNPNYKELSNIMVDYANMKNDVTLLDNLVETRTRKRGDMDNQAFQDPPCSCGSKNWTMMELGKDFFPSSVTRANCSAQPSCLPPYKCKEIQYMLTVLRRTRTHTSPVSPCLVLSNDQTHCWIPQKLTISVACICTPDFLGEIE